MLKLYERLAGLVEKLPGGVQKPILRELDPIRELFLEQRPARVMIVGGSGGISVPAVLHFLGAGTVETGESDAGWRTYRVADRGTIEILDARTETPDVFVEAGLARCRPDAVVFLPAEGDETEMAAARMTRADGGDGRRLTMVGLAFGEPGTAGPVGDSERARLAAVLGSRGEFAQRTWRVFAAEPAQSGPAAEAICAALPNCAKLEFARLTRAREAQAEIAGSLLKSFTAVCGVIGVQPIPLADLPILTTLQSLLVGMVVYVSGRPASARLIAEFAGALGLSIGVGFAFREGARALLRVLPVWGNAISGLVAGAGTYAVGRAAIAYFIEDLPLQETRKLFRRLQPGLSSFKRRALPRLHRRREGASDPEPPADGGEKPPNLGTP